MKNVDQKAEAKKKIEESRGKILSKAKSIEVGLTLKNLKPSKIDKKSK